MAEGQIQLATLEYKSSLEIALQQKNAKVSSLLQQNSYKGENVSPVDRLSSFEMDEVSSRYEPIGRAETDWERRWNAPRMFDKRIVMDSFDMIKTFKDPKSAYVEAMRAALARKKDVLALEAMFGSAQIGKTGGTTVTWASEGANQIVLQTVGASSGNVKLNVKKLREARNILERNEIDLDTENVYCVVNATQGDALRDEALVVSTEHNRDALKVNSDGRIERFLGFNFIHSERLTSDGTYTQVPVFTMGAVDFGTWDDMYLDIDRDKTLKGHPWAIYLKQSFGASRIDPKRLVEIKCVAT